MDGKKRAKADRLAYHGGEFVHIRQQKRHILIWLGFMIMLLSGCSGAEPGGELETLRVSGEGEYWSLESYEVVLGRNAFSAGGGTLHLHEPNEAKRAFFSVHVHAVIDEEDKLIQTKSVSSFGSPTNASQIPLGTIAGDTLVDHEGNPISLDRLQQLYALSNGRKSATGTFRKIALYYIEEVKK